MNITNHPQHKAQFKKIAFYLFQKTRAWEQGCQNVRLRVKYIQCIYSIHTSLHPKMLSILNLDPNPISLKTLIVCVMYLICHFSWIWLQIRFLWVWFPKTSTTHFMHTNNAKGTRRIVRNLSLWLAGCWFSWALLPRNSWYNELPQRVLEKCEFSIWYAVIRQIRENNCELCRSLQLAKSCQNGFCPQK